MTEQKEFPRFTNRTASAELTPDPPIFPGCGRKRLLYEVAAAVIKQAKLPAYKAQTAIYSLSYVLHHRREELNLKDIWKTQSVPD
ncbi:MAG: hypothetical protein IPP97_17450, partial [Candidatus Obscuribacter sp.]|nr:hypothetical protein [Candidatus Obscuribacter sp.]